MELAALLRPKNFEDFFAQQHLTAKDAPFRKLVEIGEITHSFFYGPAGVGKTSLARVVATTLQRDFYEFNATSLKIEQLRKVFQNYKNTLIKPVIFIDEVHRLSKNQQEVLLPIMENNEALILGASTANPFYTLTSAIRSRSFLYELYSFSLKDLEKLLQKALLKLPNVTLEDDAKEYLLKSSGGDARAMLLLLEHSAKVSTTITKKILLSLRAHPLSQGVVEDDTHYDLISAFIKSIRGSDLDASIYYLARMIDEGESADFIARRLVILASEDIGLANPNALTLATSTLQAVQNIGFPEARIILSECTLYLASSPKSNSAYEAINTALKLIKDGKKLPIPKNIVHHKEGYLYPHDFGGYVLQQYLQEDLHIVSLKQNGYEKKIKQWQEEIKKLQTNNKK